MSKSTEKSGIAVPPAPAELNDVTTAKYITDVTGKSLAAARLGLPATRKDPAAQKPTGPALSPGISITSEEPMVLKYKGQDYAVNDQGQWAKSTNQNAILSQSMQQFLDRQEQAILDYKPEPQAAPAATAAPVATTPEQPADTTPEQPADTTPTATDTQTQQPSFKSGTTVTPTAVTQKTTSSAAPKTKADADKLIKQAGNNPETIKAMLAALGAPA
jgi:hypothetical protein